MRRLHPRPRLPARSSALGAVAFAVALVTAGCEGADQQPSPGSKAPEQVTQQPPRESKAGAETPKQTSSSRVRVPANVAALVETDPVPSEDDAADDPAIWIHPTDPAQSLIIGTDKQSGLAVYDLAGNETQFIGEGTPNNVDLRGGFPLGNDTVSLVAAADDSTSSLAVYEVDPTERRLVEAGARTITTGIEAHGVCMYRSSVTGTFFAFVNDREGRTEQWKLFDNGSGEVDAKKVRGPWDTGSDVEGCVADDETGFLYVGEEEVGIWKYGAEPNDPTGSPKLIDSTGDGGHLVADVEGLAIAGMRDGSGFLFASSQGDNSFVIYRRTGGNKFIGKFRLRNGSLDGCEDTDGIDVTTASLGASFRQGVLVCQDGFNDDGNQNFKLVPLQRVLG